MNFDGLFIYKHNGEFICLDTDNHRRVGTGMNETEVNIKWRKYICEGRPRVTTEDLHEKDKETLKRNVKLRY